MNRKLQQQTLFKLQTSDALDLHFYHAILCFFFLDLKFHYEIKPNERKMDCDARKINKMLQL